MDVAGTVALSRQSGLDREMRVIANNLANMSTPGYRREGVVFSESVKTAQGEADSISMSSLNTRYSDVAAGAMRSTGGALDLAIDGEGFFQVEGPTGARLTRAGAFMKDANGQMINAAGEFLLDGGGAPILLPPGSIDVEISADGTVTAGGDPVAQLGLFVAAEGASFEREDGVRFRSDQPFEPAPDARIMQGQLEDANVSAVGEMTRMIEVQRAYEFSQALQEREDERQRAVVRTLGQAPQ
ncbi:flagellar hook-basal body complex protein [Pontivivens nitratireducens]|uniref:flagellar hook-basal body complex protein n=1 Tax=Pontivivens nitratireducens TaxID=2758038 RepID=UPI00163AA128|nr:flagellar hook-basal body complex protein [Pontibrevibacter nitratireducens]